MLLDVLSNQVWAGIGAIATLICAIISILEFSKSKSIKGFNLTKVLIVFKSKIKLYFTGNNGILKNSKKTKTNCNVNFLYKPFISIDTNINSIVRDFEFVPNSSNLIIGHDSGDILIWDIFSNKKIGHLRYFRKEGKIIKVSCSLNGEIFASVSNTSTITWDLKTGTQKKRVIHIENKGIYCVSVSPVGDIVAIGAKSGKIYYWNVNEENSFECYYQHDAEINVLKFSNSGKYLASGSSDTNIVIWNIYKKNPQEFFRFNWHGSSILSLCFSHDDKFLISTAKDNTLKVWDLDSGLQIESFDCSKDIDETCFVDNSIILAKEDFTIKLLDYQSKSELSSIKIDKKFTCFKTSHDGNYFAISNTAIRDQIQVWKKQNGSNGL